MRAGEGYGGECRGASVWGGGPGGFFHGSQTQICVTMSGGALRLAHYFTEMVLGGIVVNEIDTRNKSSRRSGFQ